MKKWFLSSAALWFATALVVEAVPVHGTFSGVVIGVNGTSISDPVGTAVTGSYGYDSDLLIGNRTSYGDPSVFFDINIGGQPFVYYQSGFSGLWFSVDANGIPVSGSAGNSWDLYISGNGFGLLNGLGPDSGSISAQVTYNAPVVPDAGTTAFLLGLAMAGLALGRRHLR